MVTQTYNVVMNLNQDDRAFWLRLLSISRDAYNDCATYIRENSIPLDIKLVHNEVYDWMRKKYPDISSQAIIKIYKDVISALRSIKKNGNWDKAETPVKKGRSLRLDKRLYSNLTKTSICITSATPRKRTKVTFSLYPKAQEMFDRYRPKDPLIFYKDDRFFLSIPFEVPEKPMDDETCIGVDLGMKQFFVTSEGLSFRDEKYLEERRKVRHLKRQLKAKGTKSSKRHLAKLKKREANLSKAMCHKASEALLGSTKSGIIVLEDLEGLKEKTKKTKEGYKRKRHNNAMSQVPFHKFKEILAYKALLAGKRVETVSPTYTSQTDSRTGKRDGERKGRRYYCKDGIVLDADWNAAINIGQRSKHPVSSASPFDGALTPLTGRCPSTHQSWSGENLSASR